METRFLNKHLFSNYKLSAKFELEKVGGVMMGTKVKCIWLREGDRSTKNFHHLATSHRNINFICNFLVGERNIV